MNKDVKSLIDIYKRYLAVTADLVTILERNYDKLEAETYLKIDVNGLREKREEFLKHAHSTIEDFNADLHKLLRLSWELKEIEQK